MKTIEIFNNLEPLSLSWMNHDESCISHVISFTSSTNLLAQVSDYDPRYGTNAPVVGDRSWCEAPLWRKFVEITGDGRAWQLCQCLALLCVSHPFIILFYSSIEYVTHLQWTVIKLAIPISCTHPNLLHSSNCQFNSFGNQPSTNDNKESNSSVGSPQKSRPWPSDGNSPRTSDQSQRYQSLASLSQSIPPQARPAEKLPKPASLV